MAKAAVTALLVLSPMAMFTARAGTPTSADIIDGFESAQDNILNSALQYRLAAADNARTLLEATAAELQGIQTDLQDPTLAAQLGKNLKSLNTKITSCLKAVNAAEPWVDPDVGVKAQPSTAVLNKLFSTATMARTSEQVLTTPLLAGKGGGVQGAPMIWATEDPFNYKAGQYVHFKIYPPGYPDPAANFTSPPTINIQNSSIVTALDPTYQPDFRPFPVNGKPPRYYNLTLRMGPQEGAAHFELTYNGQTREKLVYNRGGPGAAAQPFGYPTVLAKGNYQMSMSVTGTGWFTDATGRHTTNVSYGPIVIPYTFPLKSPSSFATTIVKYANTMMQAYGGAYGVNGAVTCPSSDANGFTLVFTASYGDAAEGSKATVTLTITRI